MTDKLTLHEYALSGNCYKIRLTAAHVGVALERREYDIMAGATRTPGYLKTAAKGGAPGELEPSDVARQSLDALGSGPLLIPGAFNRFASFLMRRLMSRRATIALMGSQTRKLLR